MPNYPTLSTTPSSRRGYLSQAELQQYADIVITDPEEADDQISQAEEMIDDYIGAQPKFFREILQGRVSDFSGKTQFTLDIIYKGNYPYPDYFKDLIVEMLSGNNAGQRRKVTASTPEGVLTCEDFDNNFVVNDVYKIYQLGKFPRFKDVFTNTFETPPKYYKAIPEPIRRAVAAQVQYVINMGDKFFASDASEKNAESIMDYSYNKNKTNSHAALIAPKARLLLRGYINRVGEIELS